MAFVYRLVLLLPRSALNSAVMAEALYVALTLLTHAVVILSKRQLDRICYCGSVLHSTQCSRSREDMMDSAMAIQRQR